MVSVKKLQQMNGSHASLDMSLLFDFKSTERKKNEQNWYILYNEPNKRQKLSALC